MKILAIRMKNLASLEGVTEIDFTKPPLSTAGIFAITGPMGAGKSTILDALCLALYGKTPRYLQAKEQGIEVKDGKTGFINQGDCRGILRDGAGEGYAEVDFMGIDGHAHTATWRVRRARDKPDGLMQGDSLELKNLHSGTIFPGRKKDVSEETERLVGLNFEQFTRSVLLAQGDFTAFLKAAKDDKSSLLEKLTGTHIYSEISRRVFENHKMQEQGLRELNLKREGIITLTTEELASLEERNKSAKELIETRQVEITGLDKEISWHHQFKTMMENFELAGELIRKANEHKQNASGRLVVLTQVETVQSARKFIDAQSDIARQLNEKNEKLAVIEKDLTEFNERQLLSVATLDTASKIWLESTEKYNLALPVLAKARELDVKIGGKLEEVNNAAAIVKIAVDASFQKQKIIESTKAKNENLLNSVNLLQQWKDDNELRRLIAEQENLILSKLNDARQLLTASGSFSKRISGLSNDIAAEIEKVEKLQAAAGPLKIKLTAAQGNMEMLTSKLFGVDIIKLDAEKVSADNLRADLAGAQSFWENLFEKLKDFNQSTKKLNDDQADHKEKVPQLAKAAAELQTTRTKKETSLELLQKARLSVSENVESLRGQLIAGEPCPVCGSQEHPYIVHNPQLDAVMQKLEVEYKQYERAYENALSHHSALQGNVLQLNSSMATGERELAEKDNNLRTLKSKWEKLPVYEAIQNIADEEKANWLAKQMEQTGLLQKSLLTNISNYNAQKKEQEELQKQIHSFEQQLNENFILLTKDEQARDLLQQQLSHCNVENGKLNASLKQIESNLAIYFSNVEWFNNWQNEPSVFEESITKFSLLWKEQTEKLVNDTTELHTIRATLEEQQLQLQNLLTEQESKQIVLMGLKQQYDELFKQRQLIFNGRDAKSVEATLKQSIDTALQNLDLQKVADQNLKTSIARAAAQVEQLQKDKTQLQEQELKAGRNTEQWLAAFNQKHALSFGIDELLELLQHTQEWIEEERAALRAIDDAITQAQSVLQERASRLQQHELNRMSERNVEDLEILKTQLVTVLQQASQEKTETELWLQQDEANKKKIGDLLNVINNQAIITDNWAKLNDIIGSSDGKKFRQIAQEYTLDVLLGYANMHLQSLSQRYLLERIPNTLGLQVLDQDMGNEVRTVFSLSGGESFLVSLALALGLASLSSSRMQVESLFIDEGFGSLDPATLNIAMDALERLHNQGRKVGVISHVQEMTERIPVQIKVSKENSGRSRVEVNNIF
ncbi:MAG: AAA family ATPase [Ferruginibacter sp.]